MELANLIGSLLLLAVVIRITSGLMKAILIVAWDQGLQGNHVYGHDVVRAVIGVQKQYFRFALQHKLASTSSMAVFFASHLWGAELTASLGFATIALAIVGFITPSVMYLSRVFTLVTAIQLRKSSASSDVPPDSLIRPA
jgi:hypothetical protein